MSDEIKEITPRIIIKDLTNYRITPDEAIAQIEQLIRDEVEKATNDNMPMGAEDLKEIKKIIAELLYDRYGMNARGNSDVINDSLKQALTNLELGTDFKKVPRKYFNKIKDELYYTV